MIKAFSEVFGDLERIVILVWLKVDLGPAQNASRRVYVKIVSQLVGDKEIIIEFLPKVSEHVRSDGDRVVWGLQLALVQLVPVSLDRNLDAGDLQDDREVFAECHQAKVYQWKLPVCVLLAFFLQPLEVVLLGDFDPVESHQKASRKAHEDDRCDNRV